MGEFKKKVQGGKILGPLRREFTAARWLSDFEAANTPDKSDKQVFDAGVLLHAKLESIRSCLRLSASSVLSPTTKLRAFVAAVNHNFLVAVKKTRVALEAASAERAASGDSVFRPDELVAEIKLELKGGFQWSPNEIAESLVDGVEVPIRFALQGKPSLAGNPRMNQIEWADVALELNLGIMFRHAEDLWDDCLWNEYRVLDKGKTKVFVPGGLDPKRGYAIGQARRLSLAMGFAAMAAKYHRRLMATGALPRVWEVRAITQEGKRQVIKVSREINQSPDQDELYILRGFASDPYYAELLDEELAPLGGLSMAAVLDAWVVVSRAAALLADGVVAKEALHSGPDRPAHAWLPDFAPVLRIDALVQALLAATGVSLVAARRLVDFFTFRGDPGQEIWASPLVPVGPGSVVPVFAAITSPNLRRLVDVWMRQLGIDLERRGPAFEIHLRASAAASIKSSNVLSGHAVCVPEDYTFRPSGQRPEQIDLLVIIGATVLLAEAKCVLEPTEAKGVAMHRKTVLGAADQAKRKAVALTSNRAEFVADIAARFGLRLPQDYRVVPIVVVSSATHVGVAADGIPVVDEYILEKYLEGELEDVAVSRQGFEVKQVSKNVFYSNVEEAQDRMLAYFSSPPQVRRLVDGVQGRLIPLYPVNGEDWEGFVFSFDCLPSSQKRDGDIAE